MPRRYVANYEYTEIVHGKPRRFMHETILEATNANDAYANALEHFQQLARTSGVGWQRTLERCEVAPAKRGMVAKGGRRLQSEQDSSLE